MLQFTESCDKKTDGHLRRNRQGTLRRRRALSSTNYYKTMNLYNQSYNEQQNYA